MQATLDIDRLKRYIDNIHYCPLYTDKEDINSGCPVCCHDFICDKSCENCIELLIKFCKV